MAKLNATNRYKKRESLSIFEELTLPSFKYSLSPSDTAVLREYYLYALKELQNEVLTILENMSDIRSEEIQLKKEEMLKTPNGNLKNPTESKLSKIKIKQEIVKMLAQKNTKTKKNIKKELESLTKETGLSEDTLKEELKNLLKSKDGISENFELVEVEEVNYVDFESSWELFEQVKKEYDEQVKAEAIFSKQRPKITDIELDELIAEYVKEI